MPPRIAVAALLLFASTALAQEISEREGSFEVGLELSDVSSEVLSGPEDSSLDIDGETGFGVWGGYNFTNRFALTGEATWSRPDYAATRVLESGDTDVFSAELDVATVQIKGTFYLLEGAIAPFVEIGAGWTNIDSNIVDGPPTTGCWWDPWWGYVCTQFFDTYEETRTSYSAGIGLRWDMSPYLMLRASYGVFEVDTSSGTEDAEFDSLRAGFAWRF